MSDCYEYSKEPICPYCGYKERDAWEIDFGDMEGEVEHDCGKCERTYLVSRSVSVDYSTRPEDKGTGQ